MAINRVQGNILADDLQRGANLAIQGNLIYFDVANDRVGVLTSTPGDDFTVQGTTNAGNVRITSASANGVFFAAANLLAVTSQDLRWDGSVFFVDGAANITGNLDAGNINATGLIVGNIDVGNITVSGNVSVESLTANLFVTATGNVTGGNLLSDGSITANGAAVILGNITGGNLSTANLITGGNLSLSSTVANRVLYTDSSNLVVTTSNLSFDGSALELIGSANIDNITVDGTTISSDANLDLSTAAGGNLVLTVDGTGVTQILSTTSLTIPVGNTLQRPASPDLGALRFNTSTGQVEVWDGTQWETVGSDLVAITDQTINGDGSTNVFTLDQVATSTSILVSTNGVVQKPDVAYSVTGNSITFAEAPAISDVIDVRFIAELQVVTSITNASGNSSISVENNGVANLISVQSLQLPSYTVAEATALANVANGQLIFVSNGDSGNACLAVYSTDAWKIVQLAGNITT